MVPERLRFRTSGRARTGCRPPDDPTALRPRVIAFVSWILAFFVGVWLLGFIVAGPLLTLAYARLQGRERWRVALPMAVGVAVAIWATRDLLNVSLHQPTWLDL